MVNWESQSKNPPQSPEDGHIYCILLIRIAFCHVSENLPLRCLFLRYYEHLFLFSMLKHVTSSQFCLFAKYLSLYLHIFKCANRGIHTQAHMCNQHTREMETTRHRSLVERGGRKALLETLQQQKKMSE